MKKLLAYICAGSLGLQWLFCLWFTSNIFLKGFDFYSMLGMNLAVGTYLTVTGLMLLLTVFSPRIVWNYFIAPQLENFREYDEQERSV